MNKLKTQAPLADLRLENHFSFYLLRPQTAGARRWMAEHCPPDGEHTYWCGALLVEPRYLEDLLLNAGHDGLTI